MKTIEFQAPIGYTFTCTYKDPFDTYSTITTSPATEISPGVYRSNIDHTGIVFVQVADGPLVLTGYADLDNPGVNEVSEVVDSLEQAVGFWSNTSAADAVTHAYGPKRVKTPNLEVEQFDPLMLQKLEDRKNSSYPTFGSSGISIAVPNHEKYRTGCDRCG